MDSRSPRQSRIRVVGWIVALPAVLLSACQDARHPVAPESAPSAQQAVNPGLPFGLQQRFRNIDELFIAFAGEIPGFGGYWFSGDGKLNVYLTDLAERERAQTLIARYFASQPLAARKRKLDLDNIRFHRGEYDVRQLNAWRARVMRGLTSIPGSSSVDLDEVANRVTIGVVSAAHVEAARSAIAALDVPLAAVAIEVRPVVPTRSTLRDRARPVFGGMQLLRWRADHGQFRPCTVGLNVYRWDFVTPYYLTAAHCAGRIANSDTVTHFQTDNQYAYTQGPIPSKDRISTIVEADPPWFYQADDSTCPAGFRCRYSDAALMRYTASDAFAWEKIAKPVSLGSITIDPSEKPFTVWGDYFPAIGDTLHKVGRTTGWTKGAVGRTCSHERAGESREPTDYYILCSDVVDTSVGNGDSGAPFFYRDYIDPSQVYFVGILWGGVDGYVTLSNWEQIMREIPGLAFTDSQ